MRDPVTRAGAAAIARAEGVEVPADPSAAPVSGRDAVISGRDERRGPDEARGGVVLPDEVVTRILRFVLEGPEGDGAHARWSVGGRFRVPAPDAARRRSHDGERLADADGSSHEKDAPRENSFRKTARARKTRAKRGCLRLVSKQWRRVLDRTCVEVVVRKAVVFGDEALAGLAVALRVGDGDDDEEDAYAENRGSGPARRLVLEGSHLCDGAFRLTTRGISAFAAQLPSLTSLHVERTGMDVAEVLAVATRCPNLTTLAVDGGGARETSGFGSSSKENPFESALLHDMPCTSPYAAMDALASLLRDGAGRLRSVALIGVPGLFAPPAFFSVPEAEKASERKPPSSPSSPSPTPSSSGVSTALSGCSSLRIFTLEDVGVSDAVGAFIARSLPKRLETFSVAGDDVGSKTGASLFSVLADDEAPSIALVQIPRRAAFGAVAATKLDKALKRRAAETDRSTDEKRMRNTLLVRVAEDPKLNAEKSTRFEVERFAFSMRVLRRWKVPTSETESECSSSASESASWVLSSDVRVQNETESASDATRTARATLRYLAAREDAASVSNVASSLNERSERAHATHNSRSRDQDPRLVWATTCVGSSFDTGLTHARDWLRHRQRDDSLAATVARVAARERFSRLAGAAEARLGRFREETTPSSVVREVGHSSRPTSTCHERDTAAFHEVADAVARDARTIVDEFVFVGEGLHEENETRLSADPALSRALACVALPYALERAAAEDDTFCGRDDRGYSKVPSLPKIIVDLVHDETCALLVAEDLVLHDAERVFFAPKTNRAYGGKETSLVRGSVGDGDEHTRNRANLKLVDASLFFGGSAWCVLEATSRLLAPTTLDLKFREFDSRRKNGASARWSSASFLAPNALPLWIDAGVAGSPEDAALAADVVASALFRLAGHESVSLGARGLKELAKILGKAAALVPDDAFNERVARIHQSRRRLHDAARAVFAARDFAPLLRGNVAHVESARERTKLVNEFSNGGLQNAQVNASSGIDTSAPPPPIVSWSQWLHASGAPPPLDATAAAAAAKTLRDKSAAYERMEAEAASLRARMSRLAFDLRRVARDVRTSHGFHREPAREMLLRAYGAVGFRAEPLHINSGDGPETVTRYSDASRVRQISLVESFGRNRVGRAVPRTSSFLFAESQYIARFAIHRVPSDGWRDETLSALDALFTHARRATPFFRDDDTSHDDDTTVDAATVDPGGKGWSLVNDADDYTTPMFAKEWERRCCAAMLAWYVDVRDDDSTRTKNKHRRSALDDVLRVLGVLNASDEEARLSSDGRERVPVDAIIRMRREGSRNGPLVDTLGSVPSSNAVSSINSNAGDVEHVSSKIVELDARLQWNLMLDA